jgi:hypothetical protein
MHRDAYFRREGRPVVYICGRCKQSHETAAEAKACHGTASKLPVATDTQEPNTGASGPASAASDAAKPKSPSSKKAKRAIRDYDHHLKAMVNHQLLELPAKRRLEAKAAEGHRDRILAHKVKAE